MPHRPGPSNIVAAQLAMTIKKQKRKQRCCQMLKAARKKKAYLASCRSIGTLDTSENPLPNQYSTKINEQLPSEDIGAGIDESAGTSHLNEKDLTFKGKFVEHDYLPERSNQKPESSSQLSHQPSQDPGEDLYDDNVAASLSLSVRDLKDADENIQICLLCGNLVLNKPGKEDSHVIKCHSDSFNNWQCTKCGLSVKTLKEITEHWRGGIASQSRRKKNPRIGRGKGSGSVRQINQDLFQQKKLACFGVPDHEQEFSLQSVDFAEQPSLSLSTPRMIKCSICNEYFSKQLLNQHVMDCHFELDNYKCAECEFTGRDVPTVLFHWNEKHRKDWENWRLKLQASGASVKKNSVKLMSAINNRQKFEKKREECLGIIDVESHAVAEQRNKDQDPLGISLQDKKLRADMNLIDWTCLAEAESWRSRAGSKLSRTKKPFKGTPSELSRLRQTISAPKAFHVELEKSSLAKKRHMQKMHETRKRIERDELVKGQTLEEEMKAAYEANIQPDRRGVKQFCIKCQAYVKASRYSAVLDHIIRHHLKLEAVFCASGCSFAGVAPSDVIRHHRKKHRLQQKRVVWRDCRLLYKKEILAMQQKCFHVQKKQPATKSKQQCSLLPEEKEFLISLGLPVEEQLSEKKLTRDGSSVKKSPVVNSNETGESPQQFNSKLSSGSNSVSRSTPFRPTIYRLKHIKPPKFHGHSMELDLNHLPLKEKFMETPCTKTELKAQQFEQEMKEAFEQQNGPLCPGVQYFCHKCLTNVKACGGYKLLLNHVIKNHWNVEAVFCGHWSCSFAGISPAAVKSHSKKRHRKMEPNWVDCRPKYKNLILDLQAECFHTTQTLELEKGWPMEPKIEVPDNISGEMSNIKLEAIQAHEMGIISSVKEEIYEAEHSSIQEMGQPRRDWNEFVPGRASSELNSWMAKESNIEVSDDCIHEEVFSIKAEAIIEAEETGAAASVKEEVEVAEGSFLQVMDQPLRDGNEFAPDGASIEAMDFLTAVKIEQLEREEDAMVSALY